MDYPSLSLVVRDGKSLVLSADHLLSMEPAGWQFYVEMAVSQKSANCFCGVNIVFCREEDLTLP